MSKKQVGQGKSGPEPEQKQVQAERKSMRQRLEEVRGKVRAKLRDEQEVRRSLGREPLP